MSSPTLKQRIAELYEGSSKTARRFRYTLLVLDLVTILFLIGSTFFYGNDIVEGIDTLFGIYITLDFFLRFWIANKKPVFFLSPLNLADLVVIVSFLAPLLGENFAFLRSLRMLRLLRSYRLQDSLRKDFLYFRQHEDIIMSATNLFIFIFIMTELVFVTQVGDNPNIHNFLDAMYFTIAALTTTGFGDVTLQGDAGRVLSIIIMIFGVTLFMRLIQAIFRPSKVRSVCDACGLFLHEHDAVHCKHCGKVLAIPSDGNV
jgi:voltage-gated potassium channel